MFGIALIVLVLLTTLMVESQDLNTALAGYDARAAVLNQSIEDEQTRTEELQKLKEYMLTDEYAEQAAREKLGMIKENENIFQEESGS